MNYQIFKCPRGHLLLVSPVYETYRDVHEIRFGRFHTPVYNSSRNIFRIASTFMRLTRYKSAHETFKSELTDVTHAPDTPHTNPPPTNRVNNRVRENCQRRRVSSALITTRKSLCN